MNRSVPVAVSTGSLYPLSTLESIRRLRELGVQDIELTLQHNEFHLTFERTLSMTILPELLALIQPGGLFIRSVHAPLMRAERCYNMWSRLQYLTHSIDVCERLGGQIVVIHPFHLFRSHEEALGYLANDGVTLPSPLLPGIEEILERARCANVVLALENIQDWHDEIFFNAPQNMSRFLADMAHPNLKCTFDLMHAQASGTLADFTSLAGQIVNIHASDFLPPIQRVAIGKGTIAWDPLMQAVKSLPHLHQITVELSHPEPHEITESVKFFSNSMA